MSCSNEDKTGGSDNGNTGGEGSNGGDSNSGGENGGSVKTKHELEGTWVGYDEKDKDYELKFTVDSNGNVTFSPKPFPIYGTDRVIPYTYNGKIEINSIVYSYTNDVFCSLLTNEYDDDGCGKFIFSSPSNCTAKYDRVDYYEIDVSMGLTRLTVEFTKQ